MRNSSLLMSRSDLVLLYWGIVNKVSWYIGSINMEIEHKMDY